MKEQLAAIGMVTNGHNADAKSPSVIRKAAASMTGVRMVIDARFDITSVKKIVKIVVTRISK